MLTSRAILSPTNSRLNDLNGEISDRFPGIFSRYRSADSTSCDSKERQAAVELQYPQELLNYIEAGASLPDHDISLKKDLFSRYFETSNFFWVTATVQGMRSREGLKNLLFLKLVSGSQKSNRLALPRMNCSVNVDDFQYLASEDANSRFAYVSP